MGCDGGESIQQSSQSGMVPAILYSDENGPSSGMSVKVDIEFFSPKGSREFQIFSERDKHGVLLRLFARRHFEEGVKIVSVVCIF